MTLISDRELLQQRRRALIAQITGMEQQRQGLLMELGSIEDALGVPRTRPPVSGEDRSGREERARLRFERLRGGEGEG